MKTVLITGASSGIGKETAFEYARHSYNLVLVARRQDHLEAIKNEIENQYKVNVYVIALDLSNLKSAESLYKEVNDKNLKIDVLINNAGFGIHGELVTNDLQKLEDMLVLNMVTLSKLTQIFAKNMVKNGGGHIINLASAAAFQPIPSFAAYAATKAYVMNFSDAIAYELKDKNVKITTISPGATQSEFGSVAGFDENNDFFDKTPSSKDLANFIYKAMLKNKTNTIHGLKNFILAQSNRFAPRKMTVAIAAKMMK